MHIYFLEADLPLVKTYKPKNKAATQFEKTQYPLVKYFTSHEEDVTAIEHLYKAIKYHSANGHCLLKGTLQNPLNNESRAGSTSAFDETQWLCLDLDYFDDESNVPALLSHLGLHDVDHIVQYSAGHGIDKPFAAHLYFLLDQPVLPDQLKLWLMNHNLKIEMLANNISLTRSNVALRWPLDVSVAQNDKLIFLAPPNCKGFDDPVTDRVRLVKGKKRVATISEAIKALDASVVEAAKHRKLTQLRHDKDLPAKKLSFKMMGGVEVAKNPGIVNVTGQREQRGFMYLNLNGGNSWGYYHPVDKPEILFNFKGEPNYLTKELVPTYYKAYMQRLAKEQEDTSTDGEIKYFAFLDRRTDKYYRGTYDTGSRDLQIFQTNAVKKVEDFLRQHGQLVPEFIQEWDYEFRFDDDRIFCPKAKFVNRFTPTVYLMDLSSLPKPASFPPTIGKVLMSVTGNDKTVLRHFLNWLAYIVQYRQRAQTAWVFNGVQGTGKGLLVHNILAPLFGRETVHVKSMSNLEEDFNAYMENTIFLMLDESKRSQLKNNEKAMAKLKQAITDPYIPIRRMQTDHYMARNYMNVIITANHRDPVDIEVSDRRFNVGVYQDKKLQITDDDIKQIASELGDFAKILQEMKVDEQAAKTPLENEPRQQMKFVSRTSLEVTFQEFLSGNLDHFIEHIPTNKDFLRGEEQIALDNVLHIIRQAERYAHSGEPHHMSRDEVKVLMNFVLGDLPTATQRFVSLVKHHGIHFNRILVGDRRLPGYVQMWSKPELSVDEITGEKPAIRSVK